MLRRFKIALLVLLFIGEGTTLLAQKYAYVHYDAASGTPFDEVSTIIQDQQGFIWIGSQSGLYRFDGRNFKSFSTNTKSQVIHRLQATDEHLLFVNDTGIHQIEDLSSKPKVSTLLEGNINETPNLPFYPNDLLVGSGGEIWLSQSNHSIARLRAGVFETFPFSSAKRAVQIAMAEDQNGDIWALSPIDGLFWFNRSSNQFEKKLQIEHGNTLWVHEDRLLVGSDLLLVYSIRNRSPRLVRTIRLGQEKITAIHTDRTDRFIIGTKNGKLFLLPTLNSTPQPVYGANEPHRVEELDIGEVYDIYVAADSMSESGVLWICSERGLWLLQQRFFETVNNLPMNNPIGIAFGKDENAWVPMNFLFGITPYQGDFTAAKSSLNLQANAVAYDPGGHLWVSSSTPQVEIVKLVNNQIRRTYTLDEPGEAIFYLHVDSKRNLWFCQAPSDKPIIGVGRIDPQGTLELYGEEKGFKSRILAIKGSDRGEIYAAGIGEENYLYRYDPVADRFVNISPLLPFSVRRNFEVHDLTIDPRGVVWLASTDGLLRYDSEKVTLIQDDVLQQEEVRGITHDSGGNIWVATATKGLVFHRQGESTLIDESAGLPALINAYRCIATDDRGRVWAGTPEGLVYSRMTNAHLPLSNPPRVLNALIDREIYRGDYKRDLKVSDGGRLDLEFTNLFFPAESTEYQYRLVPRKERNILLEDHLWQSNGHSPALTLNSLTTGKYFLEIRARQPGGYQWSDPLEIRLRVFKPWYQQPWFLYPLIAVLVLLGIYYLRLFARRRITNLQQVLKFVNKKLEEEHALLTEKIHEIDVKEEELASAMSTIQTLELFIQEIPPQASWNDIITAMGKAVEQSEDIDAFEICFVDNNEIVHRGYSKFEAGGYTFRSKPFNPRTSLTSWVIANHAQVAINDFDKEHELYIQRKEAYRYHSLIFVPFHLNNQSTALCAYSTRTNQFDHNDLVMIRVLVRFIILSVHQEITKES